MRAPFWIATFSAAALACGTQMEPAVTQRPAVAPPGWPPASAPGVDPAAAQRPLVDPPIVWDAQGPRPHGGLPDHVALGVPRDSDASDDYLMDKGTYVLSYNSRWNVANWVAWRLTQADLGATPRSRGFHPDPALPAAFYRVRDGDYRNSGYDRGHLCPSADRSSSATANETTFFFTNIHPQVHDMNAGPWEKLESHEREISRSGRDVYAIAGGVFGRDPMRIGRGIAVPTANYKVLISVPRGTPPASVSSTAQAIAVVVPNIAGIADDPWTHYATSVRSIEGMTGYDFLGRLPKAVQDALETAVGTETAATAN